MRDLDELTAVTDDKGYDWELLRMKLRAEGVKLRIPTREKNLAGRARNLLLDKSTYHLRSNAESVFFGLRRRYGDTLWPRLGSANPANLS